MRRRGKTGGKAPKTQHPRTLKRRNTPSSVAPNEVTDVARLTRERDEALEQLTATSEVLQIVSASPDDLERVFQSILENATRICGAKFGTLYLSKEDGFYAAAFHNAPPAFVEARKNQPLRPAPDSTLSRVARTKQAAQVLDSRKREAYRKGDPFVVAGADLGGYRTIISVPMLNEDKLIGVISIYRQEVRPFTDKEIELVQNFAAQAVIAIENTRLLNELRESLQQQTATSEVLKVVSGSPGDLGPVFDTMLANAVHVCGANFGIMHRYDGGAFCNVAMHNVPPAFAEMRRSNPVIRPSPGTGLGRVERTKKVVQILDLKSEQTYRDRVPATVSLVELAGARTLLVVPMLKDDVLLGTIAIYRQEVRPFTDKQIELVENFSAQAVIAIENTRLLNELRQSLEQQTATSEVLRVISSSATDLRPVFETIAHNSVHLCGATYGVVYRFDGEMINFVAHHNLDQAGIDAVHKMFPMRLNTSSFVGRSILERDVVHIADVAAEPNDTYAATRQALGIRTFLAVPMLRDGNPIGAIALYRREVELFSDRQIELVKAFAAQAVIAIENARLLSDLNKLNQQLEQRVTDQVSEIERMGRLRRFLPPQVADLIVASGTEKQLQSHRREITALFCDLRGFTGFSESSDPEDVMALLREYHAAIGGIINKYGGTLERYAGDGVMVVFNDPIPVDNPAPQALLMAIDMRAAIGALIEKWCRLGHEIGFGIGVAHGFATLGTIGFEGRFDYAAIGTVSNVASRLCDEAKPGQILISPRVLMAVEKDVMVEQVGEFALKGIRRPLTAYNVLATKAAE
jgi:GAF domain-containing protein/class 3 adenylate cyclase